MQKLTKSKKKIRKRIRIIQKCAIERGLDGEVMKHYNYICNFNHETAAIKGTNRKLIIGSVTVFILLVISGSWVNSILSFRCVLPSNYLVWEATRPLADCAYCENVTKPIILRNVTRRNFVVRTLLL